MSRSDRLSHTVQVAGSRATTAIRSAEAEELPLPRSSIVRKALVSLRAVGFRNLLSSEPRIAKRCHDLGDNPPPTTASMSTVRQRFVRYVILTTDQHRSNGEQPVEEVHCWSWCWSSLGFLHSIVISKHVCLDSHESYGVACEKEEEIKAQET